MTQTTVLAAGNTEATSTDIVVAAGAQVTVGLFSASGVLPYGVRFIVYQDTPGGDQFVARLEENARTTVLSGPGTYRVKRPAYTGTAFGVFTEA